MLKYVLLGFLDCDHPWTGYDLKTVMDQSTANFWHAYHSQIYTTLRHLEEEGLVVSKIEEQDDRPDRRLYTITEAGRRDLLDWLSQPLTDPISVKDVLLVKVFFSARRDPEEVLAELRLQRSQHQKRLRQYQTETRAVIQQAARHESNAREAPFWDMTRRFGVMYEQMYVTWLDQVIWQIETGELTLSREALGPLGGTPQK